MFVRGWVVFGPAEAVNKHSEMKQDQGCCVCVCACVCDSPLPLETGEEMHTHAHTYVHAHVQTLNVETPKLISQTCDFQFQTGDTNPALNIHAESG